MTEQTGSRAVPPSVVPEPRKTGRLNWRMAGEIMPHFWEPGLIDGVLVNRGMTIVYGPSGSGKTAVVVDLALRVATGMDWRANKVKAGVVVYVAAESHETTENRIWAWAQHHKLDAKTLPFAVIEDAVPFVDAAVAELETVVKQVQTETGQDPKLIVVDTLARTMKGDENAQQDMNEYVRLVDQLRKTTRAHVLIVHHTGKDESRGARGSSVLKAATDHEIEVFKESGSAHGGIKLSKVRDGELEGTAYGFMLEKRVLGLNQNGREVTTIVATEADEAPARGKGATKSDRAALVAAYIRGQGGKATPEELHAELGPFSTGKPEAERKALNRLLALPDFQRANGFITLRDRSLGQDNS